MFYFCIFNILFFEKYLKAHFYILIGQYQTTDWVLWFKVVPQSSSFKSMYVQNVIDLINQ